MTKRKKIDIGILCFLLLLIVVATTYLFTGKKIKNVSDEVTKGDSKSYEGGFVSEKQQKEPMY